MNHRGAEDAEVENAENLNQDLRKIMKKRTAYSYGEASYTQRLVREGAKDTKE